MKKVEVQLSKKTNRSQKLSKNQKTMFQKIKLFLLAVVLSTSTVAQDIHYTQFDWVPTLLNPALSGHIIDGDMQYGAIYRDQAFTVTPNSFKSFAAFADAKLNTGFSTGDFLGLSLTVLHDNAGTGSLTTNEARLNGAYHWAIKEKNIVSLGIQGAYVNRAFGQLDAFSFEEELSGNVFTEVVESDNRQYLDLSGGLSWSSRVDDNSDLQIGAGVYHINHQDNLGDFRMVDKYDLRYTAFGRYVRQLSARLALTPQVQYQRSEGAQELAAQTYLSFLVSEFYNDPVKLKFGLGWRRSDAAQLLLGLELRGWEVGLGYDYNISGLVQATRWVAGLELGVKYRHFRPEKKEPKPLPTPSPKLIVPIEIALELKVEGVQDSIELLVLEARDTLNDEMLDRPPFERTLTVDRPYQLIVQRRGYIGDTISFNTNGIKVDSLIEKVAILRPIPSPPVEPVVVNKTVEEEPVEEIPPVPEPEVEPEPEPDPTPVVVEKPKESILYREEPFVLENIFYNYNSARILPDAEPDLSFLLNLLQQYPDMVIELSSHCDARGDDIYNERLSQKRAESAKRWLTRRGISSRRIVAKGYGEYKIINRCRNGVRCSDEEHRQNRRTEFKILSGPTSIRYRVE